MTRLHETGTTVACRDSGVRIRLSDSGQEVYKSWKIYFFIFFIYFFLQKLEDESCIQSRDWILVALKQAVASPTACVTRCQFSLKWA